METNKILREVRPHFFLTTLNIIIFLIIFIVLIRVLSGGNPVVEREVSIIFSIIVLIIHSIVNKKTILIIDEEKSIYKTGFLGSNKSYEIKHIDVSDIQVSQNFFEKRFSIGSILISGSGESNVKIKINGIEDYEKVKELINTQKNKNEK